MRFLRLLVLLPILIFGTVAAPMIMIHPMIQVEWMRWAVVAAVIFNTSLAATTIMLYNFKD